MAQHTAAVGGAAIEQTTAAIIQRTLKAKALSELGEAEREWARAAYSAVGECAGGLRVDTFAVWKALIRALVRVQAPSHPTEGGHCSHLPLNARMVTVAALGDHQSVRCSFDTLSHSAESAHPTLPLCHLILIGRLIAQATDDGCALYFEDGTGRVQCCISGGGVGEAIDPTIYLIGQIIFPSSFQFVRSAGGYSCLEIAPTRAFELLRIWKFFPKVRHPPTLPTGNDLGVLNVLVHV